MTTGVSLDTVTEDPDVTSLFTNHPKTGDVVSFNHALCALYAAGHDLRDPLLSPVYGDFRGYPPVMFASGTRDLFLSDVVRTHRKLRAAGVDADLHVYEGMSHADYIAVLHSPESKDLYRELAAFVDQHLSAPVTPTTLGGVR